MLDGKGNSGVQFRSVRMPPHEMSGYQADIGEGYWGSLYDESRRNKILVPAVARCPQGPQQDRLEPLRRSRDGRQDHPQAQRQGRRSSYRETDPSIARSGLLAVQIHAGGPMEVQFKDMMIQPLPTPDGRQADAAGVPPPHGQDRPGRAEIHGLRARGLRRHQDVSR